MPTIEIKSYSVSDIFIHFVKYLPREFFNRSDKLVKKVNIHILKAIHFFIRINYSNLEHLTAQIDITDSNFNINRIATGTFVFKLS